MFAFNVVSVLVLFSFLGRDKWISLMFFFPGFREQNKRRVERKIHQADWKLKELKVIDFLSRKFPLWRLLPGSRSSLSVENSAGNYAAISSLYPAAGNNQRRLRRTFLLHPKLSANDGSINDGKVQHLEKFFPGKIFSFIESVELDYILCEVLI